MITPATTLLLTLPLVLLSPTSWAHPRPPATGLPAPDEASEPASEPAPAAPPAPDLAAAPPGRWRFEADTFELAPDARCDRAWHAQGVRGWSGPLRAQVADARGCAHRDVDLAGLDLAGPRFQLRAAQAQLALTPTTSGDADFAARLDDLWVTGCGCADPPWHLTATSATLRADAEGAATVSAWWPVLWLGPVPVAASPWAAAPVGRRRSGFLLPRLGYDGADGPFGALPFFWAPAEAFDLTLTPGWRHGRGLSGEARLRWAADGSEASAPEAGAPEAGAPGSGPLGELGAAGLLGEGLWLTGRGGLAVGPARWALDGELTTAPGARLALQPGLAARGRDHLRFDTGLSLAGATAGAGVGLTTLTDARQPGGLGHQPGVDQVVPALWLRAGLPLGDGRLELTGRLLHRFAADAPPANAEGLPGTEPGGTTGRALAEVGLVARRDLWLGPLRLQPELGVATVAHLAEDDRGEVLAAWSGLAAEAGLQRAFAGGLRHAIVLQADARVAAVADRLDGHPTDARRLTRTDPAVLPVDRAFASRALGLGLSNRLVGAGWRARLDVRLGLETALAPDTALAHDAGTAHEHLEPVQVRARLDSRWLGLDAAYAGTEAVWGQLRVGPLDGLHLGLDGARLHPEADHPWLRNAGPGRPWRLVTDARDASLSPHLVLPWGPLHLTGGAVFALDVRALTDPADPAGGAALPGLLAPQAGWRGWWSALGWTGRCDCWYLRLEANQERDRERPDVRLALGLSGP